jgi:phosphinothricin acetyltransferase
MTTIRAASEDDIPALAAIYNHYVVHSYATFDLEPKTLEERREWFSHYATEGPHRMFVAVGGGQLLGYATSSRWRPRPAYDTSIETSVYLADGAQRKGIGTALYEALFASVEGLDLHRAYAGISLPNDASVALHERFGFVKAGHFTEQGRKFGRYWDVAWYEKEL